MSSTTILIVAEKEFRLLIVCAFCYEKSEQKKPADVESIESAFVVHEFFLSVRVK